MSLKEMILVGAFSRVPGKRGSVQSCKGPQPLSPATAGLTQGSSVSPLDTEEILEWETRAWIF